MKQKSLFSVLSTGLLRPLSKYLLVFNNNKAIPEAISSVKSPIKAQAALATSRPAVLPAKGLQGAASPVCRPLAWPLHGEDRSAPLSALGTA